MLNDGGTPIQHSVFSIQHFLYPSAMAESQLAPVGRKAPAFTLPASDGTTASLTDFAGRTLVLYFYPKADTPGCTKEACGFRDSYSAIKKTGVVLLGISADTAASQKKFQDKFSLPFPLLADPEKKIANQFGA